jgi:4-hydroxy-2-oxoheptanedioate aldolase
MNKIKNFKQKLKREKGTVLGIFMKTSDPALVEIASLSGFDFVILDQEHGAVDHSQMQNLIRAVKDTPTIPIIRIADLREDLIGKALDIGAMGVQIPKVSTKEDIKKIIQFSKFYPQGERGVCRFVRAADYSLIDKKEYFKESNKNLNIIQIEGINALENIEDILSMKGIDIIFIGPYDLSQSLGVPGEIFHEKVINAMKKIIKKCKLKGKVVGTFVDTEKGLQIWKKVGVKYLAYSVDLGIFSEACRNIVLKH